MNKEHYNLCWLCPTPQYEEKVEECHNCTYWFCYKCMKPNATDELVSKMAVFYCHICFEECGMRTTWKLPRADQEKKKEKRDHYHTVKQIVAHKTTKVNGMTKRSFLIRWQGYQPKDDTWEVEEHLDGAYDLLQTYCQTNKLVWSEIDGVVGSTESDAPELNWIKMSRVVTICEKFKAKYFKDYEITISVFKGDLPETGIYLVRHEGHCFVVLYYKQQDLAYVADGGNQFAICSETNLRVRKRLNVSRIKICRFNQQTKEDHCASSAVMIVLEYVRAFGKNIIPETLICPPSVRNKIKSIHKFPSSPFNNNLINDRLLCQCGRSWRQTESRAFHMHQRRCEAIVKVTEGQSNEAQE